MEQAQVESMATAVIPIVKSAALIFISVFCSETFAQGLEDSGEKSYIAHCSVCHGSGAQGGDDAPPLTGQAFRKKWETQGVTALITYIKSDMPPTQVGLLEPGTYTAVTNYIAMKAGISSEPLQDDKVDSNASNKSSVPAISPDEGVDVAFNVLVVEDAVFNATKAERRRKLEQISFVTDAMLLSPPDGDWLHWRRTYDNSGFSPLKSINRQNVGELSVAWSFALPVGDNTITPLVHDGVLFINSGMFTYALDAVTGDDLWQYQQPMSEFRNTRQSMGLGIWGDTLYVPTRIGAHMQAINIHTGKLIWDKALISPLNDVMASAAPTIVDGKVIQGLSSCTLNPGGCYITALDGKTGNEIWRFYTIARPGEPDGDTWNGAPLEERFGAGVWNVGSYDPALGLIYYGVAQTYHTATLLQPNENSEDADNGLYTDSTIALDPHTGKLAWYYQHMPRDVWNLEWAFERTLLTLPGAANGQKLVVNIGKLGILEALDARTGKYAFSYDLGLQNVVTNIDPETGKKTINPELRNPPPGKSLHICPHSIGVRNWPATAYDPTTGIMYINLNESCMDFTRVPGGQIDIESSSKPRPHSDGNYGGVLALNLATGKKVWQKRRRTSQASAILATAGGLIFEGSPDRWFRASDSATGEILWQTRLNAPPSSAPIAFSVDGEDYIAVVAGQSRHDRRFLAFTPEISTGGPTTTLWVFKLGRHIN